GERAGDIGQSLTHGLQAHRGIGVGQPVARAVRASDGDGEVLVLLQRVGERPQGAEHAVFVDDFDLFVHGWFSSWNASIDRAAGRGSSVASNLNRLDLVAGAVVELRGPGRSPRAQPDLQVWSASAKPMPAFAPRGSP